MAKISKVINSGYRSFKKEIKNIKGMPSDIKQGYQQGARLAKMQNKDSFSYKTQGVIRKGIIPHLPEILGVVTALIPIPGISIGSIYVGKKFQKIFKK